MFFLYLNQVNAQESTFYPFNGPTQFLYPKNYDYFGSQHSKRFLQSQNCSIEENQTTLKYSSPTQTEESLFPSHQIVENYIIIHGKQKKKEDDEQEYSPHQEAKKVEKTYAQNVKRNIMPNIVHQIFCYLYKRKRSGRIVQQYFFFNKNSFPKQANIKRFYNYQKLLKQKTSNYVTEKNLKQLNQILEPECTIYTLEQQKQYLKINRILVRHFLRDEFKQIILTSQRMKGSNKLWHLEAKRKLDEDFAQLLTDF